MLKMMDSSPRTSHTALPRTAQVTNRRLRVAVILSVLAGSILSAAPVLAQSGTPRPEAEIEADAKARLRDRQERMRQQYLQSKLELENLQALQRELQPGEELSRGQLARLQSLERTVRELERQGIDDLADGNLEVRNDPGLGFQIDDPDEMISLDFTEPVALSAFVDFVSRTLQVNITITGGVADDPITFKAPVQVRAGDLPVLLSTLLSDRGAALVDGELGWYRVVPADRITVNIGKDGLSTTRIVATPMVRPSSLLQLMAEVFPPPGGIKFSAVDELGVAVLTGGSTQLAQAERLIAEIIDERASMKLHRIPLVHVSADFARQRIIDLDGVVNQIAVTVQRPSQPGQPATGSLTNLGSFLYVDAGNALLFRGNERDFERVKELAEVVDIVSPLLARRYVAGSLVTQVAKAGEQLGLGAITSADEGSQQFTPGALNRSSAGLGNQATPSQFGSSRFVVDPNSGSFVYHGTPEQHERVEALVKDFRDQAIDTGEEIRVYKLIYASAGGGDANGGSNSTGGSSSLSLSDGNTTQPTGPGIAELLEALINNEDDQATGRFLPSGSGTASVVNTDVINDILAQPEPNLNELDQVLASDSGGTRLSATSDNTRIVADSARNQLIIRAPVKVHEQLEQIIKQLDRPRRQVLVEVQIVSLTTTDEFNFAADVQINAGDFSFLSALGVTTPGTSISTPVGVGAASGSGLTTGVIRSDFVPIAINALQSIGEARIVSTPQILVNDNQEGNIRSVREEPTEVTNQTTGAPTTTSQGPSVEAGTELIVRPQIAGDNSVSLNFAIEVSSFDVSARRGNLTPPKQTEAYNSVVSVPSNSTIIVGGFRFDEMSEAIDKIPLLGDIPLLGEFFKSRSTRDQSRVIYVFITPTVISETGQRDLRLITEGPLKDSEAKTGRHELRPALIPLRTVDLGAIRPDLVEAGVLGTPRGKRN
ncbi:MAG: type II secretion system protein GspD [Phycisphaerales bacterium JB050]